MRVKPFCTAFITETPKTISWKVSGAKGAPAEWKQGACQNFKERITL
jgi:hypothetical protein